MARLSKRNAAASELTPYWSNPNVSIVYELQWGRETIVPGTLIKIKNDRSQYRFTRLVVDSETGKEWIDCMNVSLGGFYSFYVDRIKDLVHKRSRVKKNV